MKHTQPFNTLPDLVRKIGWFYTFVSTGCLSGYAPVASGTFGTAVAIPIYLALLAVGRASGRPSLQWGVYLAVTVALFWLGVQGADKIEQAVAQKDSGIIVIDEIVGYLVTMLFVPQQWFSIVLGFFVFRFFDILKPYPIRKLDQNPNLHGFGVMIDDVLAGVYGAIVMHLVVVVRHHYGW